MAFPAALEAEVALSHTLDSETGIDVEQLSIPGTFRCIVAIPGWTFEFYVNEEFPEKRPYAMFFRSDDDLEWRKLNTLPFSWSPKMTLINTAKALGPLILELSRQTGVNIGEPMTGRPQSPPQSPPAFWNAGGRAPSPIPSFGTKPGPVTPPPILASPSDKSHGAVRLKHEERDTVGLAYAGDGWWTIERHGWAFRFLMPADYPFKPPVMTMYRHLERDPDPDHWAEHTKHPDWRPSCTLEVLAVTLATDLNAEMHGANAPPPPPHPTTPPPRDSPVLLDDFEASDEDPHAFSDDDDIGDDD